MNVNYIRPIPKRIENRILSYDAKHGDNKGVRFYAYLTTIDAIYIIAKTCSLVKFQSAYILTANVKSHLSFVFVWVSEKSVFVKGGKYRRKHKSVRGRTQYFSLVP